MPPAASPHLKSLALACLLACCLPAGRAHAQQQQGPARGTELREVLEQLDRTSLAGARVGVSHGGAPGDEGALPEPIPSVSKATLVYSQGFKLANLEGCTLTLRNDDVKLLRPARPPRPGTYMGDPQTRYVAEVYVALDKVGERKGRAPYRHTKDAEKARVFGVWRSEYKQRRFRPRDIGGVSVFPAGRRERHNYFGYGKLFFTFDTREAGEQFDSAFRRAVKLCQPK